MDINDIDTQNIEKMIGVSSSLSSMNGILGNFAKIPEIASIKPIDPFHKSITTEEALEEESDYIKENFYIDEHNCEICKSTLESGAYILKDKKKEKILYFCSLNCLKQFRDNCHNINDYELFDVSRCASYKCCLDLGNLRRMCERTKSLTNIDMIFNLDRVNFCEPAVAGQIQASYAIYKHLQRVDEENSKLSEENTNLNRRTQFLTIVSTIMAILTIVLTGISVVKSFLDRPIEYKDELVNIEKAIHTEQNQIKQIEQTIENKISDIEKVVKEKEIMINVTDNNLKTSKTEVLEEDINE